MSVCSLSGCDLSFLLLPPLLYSSCLSPLAASFMLPVPVSRESLCKRASYMIDNYNVDHSKTQFKPLFNTFLVFFPLRRHIFFPFRPINPIHSTDILLITQYMSGTVCYLLLFFSIAFCSHFFVVDPFQFLSFPNLRSERQMTEIVRLRVYVCYVLCIFQ